jgi:ATPase subunit of ABC transporter with duplicated ATPase domains
VDYETISLYRGNYSRFESAKEEDRARREAEIEKQEREIADLQAFADRFRAKATKARQAQSKLKQMERIVIEPLPRSSRRYPVFRFPQCRPSGKMVMEASGISKAYGDNQVLREVSLAVPRGDRMAIIGPNGIGKSTLLKILMSELEGDEGRLEWGYETHPGYFPQDPRSLLGDPKRTVESWLWEACPGEPVGFVRGRLAQVLFSGEEVDKKIRNLSGGEASRLLFCRLGIEEPNVLVLDEPTNHLDLEAIQALVTALRDFEGTLIFVSHDRWFVSELATRILEITPQGIQDFPGTYSEYLESCGDDHLDGEQVDLRVRRAKRAEKARRRDASPGRARKEGRELRAQRRELEKELEEVTVAVEEAEARVNDINELFADPGFFSRTPHAEVRKLEHEQKEQSARAEERLARWEALEEELETVAGRIAALEGD